MKTIEREVIIVGAGPGGSTCAGYLAREGIDVLLLEKETFPREKPCGEGLGGDAVAVVARGYMRNVKGLDGWNEFFFDEAVTPGYVWLMPYEKYEKGFVNFGIGYMRKAYEGRKLMEVANEWLNLPQHRDRFVDMEWAAPMKGWRIPQNYLQGKNAANGLLLIGDAAAMNVPVSGEGVGPAMCSGAWASLTVMDALKKNDFTLEGGLASYPEYVNKYMVPEFREMRKLLDNIYDPVKCNAYIRMLREDPVANAKANEGFQGKLMFYAFPFKNVKVD